VLVSEPEIGLQAIGYLKESGGGRSAFVPLETHLAVPEPMVATFSRPFEGEGNAMTWSGGFGRGGGGMGVEDRTKLVEAHAAIGGEGVLGRIAGLVDFAEGYERVGKRLLGGTVVVDHLDRALQLLAIEVIDDH